MSRDARRVELSTGVSLPYVSVGPDEATPVILLHAWAETGRSFDRLLPLLPDSIRAIVPDQRGHGDAERPAGGYSLESMAQDIVALLEALGLLRAVLLGSSSGGYVAQQVAAICPSRVSGLVLVGAPGTLQGRPSFADEIEQLADPLDESWVRDSLTWFPRVQAVPSWYVEDRVQDGVRIPARVWRATFEGLCAATPPSDGGRITTPTLILWGEDDELLTREHQADLVRAIPGSRLVAYPDTGHLVLWEQPAQVAADLTSFVQALKD
ncbi:MAG: alpha/beta hydrolase [Ornithinimicrobium sp.]